MEKPSLKTLKFFFEKYKTPFIFSKLSSCLKKKTYRNYKSFCDSQYTDYLDNKIRRYTVNNSTGQPVSKEKFWENNQEVLGFSSIPEQLKNQNFLQDISNISTAKRAIRKLERKLPRGSIVFSHHTIHAGSDNNGILLDNVRTRFIVYIPGPQCDKTFLISYPTQKDDVARQMGMYAYCHKNPKTNEPLENPQHYLFDYYRSYAKKVTIDTRIKAKGIVGENCITCHSRGPILINHLATAEVSKRDKKNREKLNKIYKTYKRGPWAHFDEKKNSYIDMFSSKIYRNTLGQMGPVMEIENSKRQELFETCLPKDSIFDSKKLTSKKRLKSIINKGLNCSSCHNIHGQGAINQSLFERRMAQLEHKILSSDNGDHQMPPGFVSDISKKDHKRLKEIFYSCFTIENTPSSDVGRNLHIKKYISTEKGYSFEQILEAKKSKPYFSSLPSYSCQQDKNDFKFSKNQNSQLKPTLIEFTTNDKEFENNKAYCVEGLNQIRYPLTLLPYCQTECAPFEAVLIFDTEGSLKSIENAKESFKITKYGHKELTQSEISKLTNWISKKIQTVSSIPVQENFVDSLSGATKLDVPVPGAGLTTHLLLKYSLNFSKMIKSSQDFLPSSCKK